MKIEHPLEDELDKIDSSNSPKTKKLRFLPLNEDKCFFILWTFCIYTAGLVVSYSIPISLLCFFIASTALLNNVGHLMREKEKKEEEI